MCGQTDKVKSSVKISRSKTFPERIISVVQWTMCAHGGFMKKYSHNLDFVTLTTVQGHSQLEVCLTKEVLGKAKMTEHCDQVSRW